MAQQEPIRKRTGSDGSASVSTPQIPDKLYFRIGEVARLCGVPAYVLRFWESEFPQLKPNKGGTGQRLYRRRDVETALNIKTLLYDEGYTIPGARQAFKAELRIAKQPPLGLDEVARPVDTQQLAALMGFAIALFALAGCAMMKPASQPAMPVVYLAFFHPWSADIGPEAHAIIDQAAQKAKVSAPSTITVAGYTDNVGTAEENKRLSEQRVMAVQNALIADGVDPKLFLNMPLGPADDTAGPTGDRRIEIRLQYGG